MKLGKYIHFEGKVYTVTGIATHSETLEKMVVYNALDEDRGTLVCPISVWDEVVEYHGQKVKRFTHETEYIAVTNRTEASSAATSKGVHYHSLPKEKIDLFLTYFTGRSDVFAIRFVNIQKGITGYVPACYNARTPLCPRANSRKVKCGECTKSDFMKFDANNVEKHLKGEHIMGAYPMLPDETCKFLAFDFDGKECDKEELLNDVTAIRDVAIEKNISLAVERSRSGKGYHFWIFFTEFIPVHIARKFGSSLITYAMSKQHNVTFKTYDRLIPTQDTMPKGGFGNLIALPLQLHSRKQGNSEFVDENFSVVPDQWNYLYHIKKYTLVEIEQFINDLAPDGEMGLLSKSSEEDEKPWERKKLFLSLLKMTFLQRSILFVLI